MKLWDYHTHNQLCKHATGSLEDYVKMAIKKGLVEIGLSDHFPMYLLPEEAGVWKYSMDKEEFPLYLKEIKRLQKQYKEKIIIRAASEVDFYPEAFENYKKVVSQYWEELDYIIGSMHVIHWEGIRPWPIDDLESEVFFKEFGTDKVYSEYYDRILQLVKTGFYDILGHLDLPKKYGFRPNDTSLMREKVLRILDAVEEKGMAVEINMAGLYKPVGEQYPEKWIIEELIQRKIPLTLGSDSHKPENLAYHFEDMLKFLLKEGVDRLAVFENHELSLHRFI